MKGLVEQSEMKALRLCVVHLHNNLDNILLQSDKEKVKRYIKTTRRFTQAEAVDIGRISYALRMKEFNNGKDAKQ